MTLQEAKWAHAVKSKCVQNGLLSGHRIKCPQEDARFRAFLLQDSLQFLEAPWEKLR